MEDTSYLDIRNKTVRKANELIQKSRFSLSLQQQKIVLYLISQITPYDDDFKLYEFSIIEFCKVCGIDYDNGKNYIDLKNAIKEIADKSLWITLSEDKETLVRWIEKPYINPKEGIIKIRIDKDMKPFLLHLKQNFTTYELVYTLYFKSKYTIRLYELIKSIHFHELNIYKRKYTIEELKRLLDANSYDLYKNFKARVLLPSIKEINLFSDKDLSFIEIKKNKKVIAIEFEISTKSVVERLQIRDKIEQDLGPEQFSLFDNI